MVFLSVYFPLTDAHGGVLLIEKKMGLCNGKNVALCYRGPKAAALFGVAAAKGDKHGIILSAILKVVLCAGIYI